jgi:hypothetical protein
MRLAPARPALAGRTKAGIEIGNRVTLIQNSRVHQTELTEVEHVRINKIILHDVWEVDRDEFTEIVGRRIAKNVTPEILWANGATFFLTEFPETERIVNDRLEGIQHYKTVVFTRMDYEPELLTIMQGRIGVDNVEGREEYLDLANYLIAYYQEHVSAPVQATEASEENTEPSEENTEASS